MLILPVSTTCRHWGLPMPNDSLVLEAVDVKDAQHWYWRLNDPHGNFLIDHEVALDPNDWEYEAFIDLYGYLRHATTPHKREQDEAKIVEQIGAWAGERVLGPIGPKI